MASEIHKARTKGFMVGAARRILAEEGADAVTMRRVGEAAGFSYATIYGYFKDRDHLLWHVVMAEIGGMVEDLKPLTGLDVFTLADIKRVYLAYAGFFLDRPAVFDLFFFNRIGEPPEEYAGAGGRPELAELMLGRRGADVAPGNRCPTERLAELLTAAVHGALLMQLSGKSGLDRAGFEERLAGLVESLLSMG